MEKLITSIIVNRYQDRKGEFFGDFWINFLGFKCFLFEIILIVLVTIEIAFDSLSLFVASNEHADLGAGFA